MNVLTNEQIEQILDGAPDWQKCYCTETNQRFPYENYRNLSDLNEILELRQEVERLKAERDSVCHLNDSLSAELNQLREQGDE